MKLNSKSAIWVLAAALSASASAVVVPTASVKDSRIQTVMYSPNDVVHVRARIGNAVLVQLEDDERLNGDETAALGMGDASAWKLSVKGNNIIFKPAAASPDTNMIITTNKKRTYVFDLSTSASKGKKAQATTYVLRFIYPDTAAYKARAEAEKQARALEQLRLAGQGPNAKHNYDYWGTGDKALAPTAAYDNGRFTYFSFDNGRELPLIYKVMDDGTEALLNSHVDGDTVVVHETAKRYVLRLGKSVLGLENRGYNENGSFNRTGSGNRDFVRLSKEKEGK
ncbi:P-type conjugative transfer protein VirB9 [Neisseria elongata]|jgi:P-type conjugative transfer protein virB9|uniref:P-type conjugative transfer protein VirB9 n=1 Tax=Neisseria elongata TaxID=495 RepID=UPI0028E36C10|nr:P-type conjugative transfer protein VirB9 [Neisseria elongata]